ncbi:hypothetical protein L910_1996 [Vibrio fluvialis PG41]|uniref:Uncharacterized protein n=1 Tax=Vibrio fluvialis PG41 TaxID=1336752 RepID=S7HXW5_VIBFL|nr:hypothetical protein L910_1996 [Vibrio fluvialis PG41]
MDINLQGIKNGLSPIFFISSFYFRGSYCDSLYNNQMGFH